MRHGGTGPRSWSVEGAVLLLVWWAVVGCPASHSFVSIPAAWSLLRGVASAPGQPSSGAAGVQGRLGAETTGRARPLSGLPSRWELASGVEPRTLWALACGFLPLLTPQAPGNTAPSRPPPRFSHFPPGPPSLGRRMLSSIMTGPVQAPALVPGLGRTPTPLGISSRDPLPAKVGMDAVCA